VEYELHVQRAENAYKAFLILKKRGIGDYGVIVSVEEKDIEIVEEVYRALKGLV